MPEMPAFLADVLVPRFARHVRVVEVVDLAPRLRRVRFESEALRGRPFRAGQEVEFRVSARAFRHYTPARFEPETGTFEIAFFLHGHGPGSEWASRLRVDQRANVLGPGGRFELQPVARHVLLGDETTLGLFECFSRAAPGRCRGAIEVDPVGRGWPALFGLTLEPVERTGARGDGLLRWVEDARLPPSPDVCFYLAGHTGSILRIRERLLSVGWPKQSIRTKPYWADGKSGL